MNSAGGGSCYNSATGQQQPCSDNCEPAAVGAPQWQLINASNATAGLVGTFDGMFLTSQDSMACAWDPNTGTPVPRSSAVNILCDPAVAPGTVVVNRVNEVRERERGGFPCPCMQPPLPVSSPSNLCRTPRATTSSR